MKKYRFLSALLAFVMLLLLTACQTVPTGETELASSIPSSSSVTPPSSSVVPPTSSVPPTTSKQNYCFIYSGDHSFVNDNINPDLSGCTIGGLYWLNGATEEVMLVSEEKVVAWTVQGRYWEGPYAYYVKEAEPTKIYRTVVGDFSQHEVIHETAYGDISYITSCYEIEQYLQIVTDYKEFAVLELDTGKETVLMEQYYISGSFLSGDNGVPSNYINFTGKHTEDEIREEHYIYIRNTGETVVNDSW